MTQIIPSSGVIDKLKLRRSDSSGKLICIVSGRASSVKSGKSKRIEIKLPYRIFYGKEKE